MCGRYLFKLAEDAQLKDWLERIPIHQQTQLSLKDIYPSQQTLVLTDELKPAIMTWGIPKFNAKGRVINARIEGVDHSLFFKHHLQQRRVIVQADAFYEWDKDKHRHLIKDQRSKPLYMAGLYDEAQNFAIITTESQGLFAQFHHRVPLLLNHDDIHAYLNTGLRALNLKNLDSLQHLEWINTSTQMRLF